MNRRARRLAVALLFLFLAVTTSALAEGRTVRGTIVRIAAPEGAFTIRDAAGVSWSYKADPDAGIDLSLLREGDRVTVSIGRPTPLNMITAADRLRKGDRVEKDGR